MGKINANNAVKSNGLFSKVLDNLNPSKSFKSGTHRVAAKSSMKATDEFKEVKNNINAARELLANRKELGLNSDSVKNLRKEIKNGKETTSDMLKKHTESTKDTKFEDLSTMDKVKAVGGSVIDYYNPLSKNSPGALGMATRYGATAGAISATSIVGRYASGGNISEKNDGTKNIAGIPLV